MSGKNFSQLESGDIITGFRRHAEFRVKHKLGEGSNGIVYLATGGIFNTLYAIKICKPGADLKLEIAQLRRIAPRTSQGRSLFIAEDECVNYGAYYIMAYIQGVTISDYIREHGQSQIYKLGYDLLGKLALLHNQGFLFGDIKLSNVLVNPFGRVELIDYGGAVAFGDELRQFTEVYDREYWQCGTRTADMGYDLFSFAMLIMQLCDAELPGTGEVVLLPHNRNEEELLQELDKDPLLEPVAPILMGIIQGQYPHSYQALKEWRVTLTRLGVLETVVWRNGNGLLSSVIIVALLVFITSLYLSFQS